MSRDFDAIVVGSGPGGSTAADVLTAAGWSVLIFERGKRRRTDGYDTGCPLPGRKIRLYDLENDPHEFTDLSTRPENAGR